MTDPQVRHFIDKCLAPVSERLSATQLLEDPFLDSMASDSSMPRCCPSLTESVCSPMSLPADAEPKNKVAVSEKSMFKLRGEMEEGKDSILMTLSIVDSGGQAEKAGFVFSLETDTGVSVAEEMEKDLGLSSENASLIAELIENLCLQAISTNVVWLKLEVRPRLVVPYLIKMTSLSHPYKLLLLRLRYQTNMDLEVNHNLGIRAETRSQIVVVSV